MDTNTIGSHLVVVIVGYPCL